MTPVERTGGPVGYDLTNFLRVRVEILVDTRAPPGIDRGRRLVEQLGDRARHFVRLRRIDLDVHAVSVLDDFHSIG